MKNPLRKRIPRELAAEWKKYLSLFLLMMLTIGFVAGMFVANNSMELAAFEAFEKYDIEDGHFTLAAEAADSLLEELEEEENIHIVPQFYMDFDEDSDADGKADAVIRLFAMRSEVNRACLMDGAFPEAEDEIVIDRMHADNQGIRTGDVIRLNGEDYTVSGRVSFSDYSTLFKDNSDVMFDALTFDIGAVTEEAFEKLSGTRIYQYAFVYDDPPETDAEKKERAEELAKNIAVKVFFSGLEEGTKANELQDFVPEFINQAIHFAPEDFGSDKAMGEVLLILFIAVLAFIFAITQDQAIVREAPVIGTLRATGYTKMELLGHYAGLPIAVTLLSALCGNLLGYTVFKNVVVAMYYNSYSLPSYVTRWNADAFVKTTVYPVILVTVITVAVAAWRLRLDPLRFLRRDIGGGGTRRAVKLPAFRFLTRLRIRIFLQNLSGYVTLLLGILFVMTLLAFSVGMPATLSNYQERAAELVPAPYQTVLKSTTDADGNAVETQNTSAEPYSMESLLTIDGVHEGEEISVYGYVPDSRYFDLPDKAEKGTAWISATYAEKFGIAAGDLVTLKEQFGDQTYTFSVSGIYDSGAALALFLPNARFNELFELEEDQFTGYLSEEELADIDEDLIYTVVTAEDVVKTARQLDHSIGAFMKYFSLICVVMALLILYLLTKLIIEHSAGSISMMKVLGYTDREVSRLYVGVTSVLTVVFAVATSFAAKKVVEVLWRSVMADMSGWFAFYLGAKEMTEIILAVIAAYFLVAFLDLRRIRRIPLQEALKDVE